MSEYEKSFLDQLKKVVDLTSRIEELSNQRDKLKNLAVATFELMDENEKAAYSEALEELHQSNQSLTQAVRRALTRAGSAFQTPVQIRDQLDKSGYDFSDYQSNPLVSIYSTLKRMKDELEIVNLEEGTKGYRFRRTSSRSRLSR